MSVRAVVFVIIACCLAGCDTEPEQDQRRPDPVAVYASVADGERFDALVQSFTEETGIRVILKTGDPDLIVKAVIADNGSPPADVLLTADIARAWLAADEGGLRAVQSEQLGQAVAARLRDPENLWFAIGVRRAVIVYDQRTLDLGDIGDYANLSDARLRDKLCLSSSSLPVSRALIAMLIADIGQRPAEIVVRGWKRNLAQLVFDTEADMLEAIESGRCGAGIASDVAVDAFLADRPESALAVVMPAVAHINVDAAGIARHARNPAGAQELIEWLARRAALTDDALAGVSTNNVGIAGWRDEDAIKLAERAAYP